MTAHPDPVGGNAAKETSHRDTAQDPAVECNRLALTRPDDWHLHLRDGEMLASVLPDTARRFARAIVMPNLKPPVTTVEQARAYRERIQAAVPRGLRFEPLMTLYLTDFTAPEEIARAKASGFVHALKYYPAGATTNSENGVTDLNRVSAALTAMEKHDMPLLIHGEVTDAGTDVFDREAVFIERHLTPLVRAFPGLRMVLEHITTDAGAQFVTDAPNNVAATITAHHLLLNRNAMFAGGLRPHHYCLPVLKREPHRQALLAAATSGNPKFFLGTDSAPHPRHAKESDCGCAGIYTAHAALELYAEAFEQAGSLQRLEAFASFHGADFYRLPRNTDTVTLERRAWTVAEQIGVGHEAIMPFRANQAVAWQLADLDAATADDPEAPAT
ncbi:MAG: dihydroorotase [Pseudoxanthomonas sp.]